MQSYGSPHLDASLLLIPQVGFLPPDDPRVRGTIEAIERDLVVDGLVLRYSTATDVDALPPGEGTFLPCSFWLADSLVLTRPPRRRRGVVRAPACAAATTSDCCPRNTIRARDACSETFRRR